MRVGEPSDDARDHNGIRVSSIGDSPNRASLLLGSKPHAAPLVRLALDAHLESFGPFTQPSSGALSRQRSAGQSADDQVQLEPEQEVSLELDATS
jgi:hypothetical protein